MNPFKNICRKMFHSFWWNMFVMFYIYLFDENLTQKKFVQLQLLRRGKKTILHSYHLRLLQIWGWIFSTLEGMMKGRKRTRTHEKVGSRGLSNSGRIYMNQVDLCESRQIQSTATNRLNCPKVQRHGASHERCSTKNCTRLSCFN